MNYFFETIFPNTASKVNPETVAVLNLSCPGKQKIILYNEVKQRKKA